MKALLLVLAAGVGVVVYIELAMSAAALPRYGKAGVALIAKDTYVLTYDARNTIQGSHSVIWTGDLAAKRQSAFVWPVYVQFRPDRIRFFDFSRFRGGNYLRDPAKSPNQALERTVDRRDNLLLMTSTPKFQAALGLVSGRSAYSR